MGPTVQYVNRTYFGRFGAPWLQGSKYLESQKIDRLADIATLLAPGMNAQRRGSHLQSRAVLLVAVGKEETDPVWAPFKGVLVGIQGIRDLSVFFAQRWKTDKVVAADSAPLKLRSPETSGPDSFEGPDSSKALHYLEGQGTKEVGIRRNFSRHIVRYNLT